MDQKKLEAFSEQIVSEINSSMSVLNMYLGHKLGLFEVLAHSKGMSPFDLANQTGYNERYIQEWLECMTVNGYIDYNESTGTFSISKEHATAFCDSENPNYISAFLCWIPSLAGITDPLIEAFKTGGGVPYEAYGNDTLEAVGMGNRPMFINDFVESWIPKLPDIEAKLDKGANVADIGCGTGWSAISLAKGFPNITIDAYDLDKASIDEAKKNAKDQDVFERISFHLKAAEDIQTENHYDLVCAFECIHDMAYPVPALKKMKEMLAPGGAVLISDEAAGENLLENSGFLGRLLYNFSVLHCLPQSMVFSGSARTGTVMSASKLKEYAKSAGFTKIDILPINNPFWRFYRLEP